MRCLKGMFVLLFPQVYSGQMSLTEMKQAAEDIKKMKPIQRAIMDFLKIKNWEDIAANYTSEVSPGRLSRFMASFSIVLLN